MVDSFAVHLGGGLYLDASGALVFGPPSNAQVYKAPPEYSVDLKKITEAVKTLGDLLPVSDDDKKKWKERGVPPALVDWLGKLGKIVGVASSAVSIYLWGIGAM